MSSGRDTFLTNDPNLNIVMFVFLEKTLSKKNLRKRKHALSQGDIEIATL